MERRRGAEEFSLLGGPLHRLGCRLGLVRNGTNTVALGLALGVFPWVVLLALVLTENLGSAFFSIGLISSHVRLLVAIPLLFVCESFVDPRFAAFVRLIVQSQIVPANMRPALDVEIARIVRWRDSWLPEAVFLVAAVLLALSMRSSSFVNYLSGTAGWGNPGGVSAVSWASQWGRLVCIPLFYFLWLRWYWRLGLWCFLLWRVSRLQLRLVATHPDGAGGLGFLELVHSEFAPMVMAISATLSASLAQDIALGRTTFDAIVPVVALILCVDVVLFLGPLLVFSRKLWNCKVQGLSDYSRFAERYVSEFESKWLGNDSATAEGLLGTSDIQALADLNSSVGILRNMRIAPISAGIVVRLAAAALLPLLPLVLFKHPLGELLRTIFGRMSGL